MNGIDTGTDTPTFKAFKKYGISPSKLRYMVDNLFYFPDQYKDCLSMYHLEIINTKTFINSLKEGMITPWNLDTSYQVIYHQTDPTRLHRRAAHTSVKLSFRIAQSEFGIIPTVLVKEVRES